MNQNYKQVDLLKRCIKTKNMYMGVIVFMDQQFNMKEKMTLKEQFMVENKIKKERYA